MITYLSFIFIVIGSSFFALIKNKKISRILTIVTPLFFFIIMMTLRDFSVGGDLESYINLFNDYSNGTAVSANRDFLFYLVLRLFSYTKNFRLFLFFEYSILCVALFLFMYRLSSKPSVSLLLLIGSPLFELFVSGLRQTFACALFLLGFVFLLSDKKYMKILSIVFIVLSIFSHLSLAISLVIFPVFFLTKKGMQFKHLYILVPVYCCFLICIKYVFDIFNTFHFMEYGFGGTYLGLPKISIMYFCFFVILYILHFANFGKIPVVGGIHRNIKSTNSFHFIIFFIFLVIYSCASWNNNFGRFGYPFLFSFFLLVPSGIDMFEKASIRHILCSLIILFSLSFFVYNVLVNDSCEIYPFLWM